MFTDPQTFSSRLAVCAGVDLGMGLKLTQLGECCVTLILFSAAFFLLCQKMLLMNNFWHSDSYHPIVQFCHCMLWRL